MRRTMMIVVMAIAIFLVIYLIAFGGLVLPG